MNIAIPRRSAGFTLIELVIVITIIGVLAAIALPKFISLQRDARIAKLQAARGAVNAAAAMGHSAFLVAGGVTAACPAGGNATNTANGTVCTEGGLVQLANGYPSGAVALGAATPGIIGAAGLVSSPHSPTLAQLNNEGYAATVNGNSTTFSIIGGNGTASVTGGQANTTCSFIYTSAALANTAATVSVVTTTGC